MNPLIRIADRLQRRRQIEAARGRLYRIAWSWCHDPALADDLVQECMLRALQKADRLRQEDRLEVWLTRILSNLHKDHLRRQREIRPVEETDLPPSASAEDLHQRQAVVSRVRAAVAQLGDEQRKVVTLVDLMEFSYAEVAATLDIPLGTVMSRLCRARRKLKETLTEASRSEQSVPRIRSVK